MTYKCVRVPQNEKLITYKQETLQFILICQVAILMRDHQPTKGYTNDNNTHLSGCFV
ncbi:hypothetical protein Hanom_Chr04g00366151 [Helianthus anomalus]